MSGAVWRPIGAVDGALVVLDAARRVYAALNSAGDGYHLIQPARLHDPRVGDGLIAAGDLCCTCEGGTFKGKCYRIREALVLEGTLARASRTALEQTGIAWFDAPDEPAGAGYSVEAGRG